MKRDFRRGWVVAACALVAIGLLFFAFRPPAIEVDVAHVSRGPLQVSVDESGKTRIRERFVISAPLGGQLLRIDVHEGDALVEGTSVLAAIEPGDPALLDARTIAEGEARVQAAQAECEVAASRRSAADAALDFSLKEQARVEELLPRRAASQAEYDAVVLRLRTARDDARAAEFATKIAAYELQMARAAVLRTRVDTPADRTRLEIRSPISGQVLRVFQESAGLVAPGTRLLEIGDPRDMEIEIDVLSPDAVRIPSDARVILEHSGLTRPLEARVRRVEPQAFLKVSALGIEEQRVNVLATFIDPPEVREKLGDAFRVEARIVVWESPSVLKVSAGALFRHQGRWATYRISGGRARIAFLNPGRTNGLETQILSGLSEDDPVVAYPDDSISPGARVRAR